MSEGEVIFLVVHSVAALWVWLAWLNVIGQVKTFGRPRPGLKLSLLTPVLCLVLTVAALQTLAASDVVGTFYVVWYAVMTAAWVGVAVYFLLPLVGLHWRGDAVERRNPAALLAINGTMVGLTLAFLGGNFGDGPGWWCVAFCGVLAIPGVLACWVLIATFSPAYHRITVERDLASGLRVGGLMIGVGLVLGRAVAGDWVSFSATWVDFFMIGWFALPLVLVEIVTVRFAPLSRSGAIAMLGGGVVPATLYLGLAAWYVLEVGWW